MGIEYFIHVNSSGEQGQVWPFDGSVAKRVGISNPPPVQAQPGESFPDLMLRTFPTLYGAKGCTLHKLKLKPGEYYPRIARPSDQHPHESPGSNPIDSNFRNELASLRGQLFALHSRLEQVCQTVQPQKENFETFGHDIRNLIILASTEVETHWRAVLKANDATPSNGKTFTTNDFVKLMGPLGLGGYSISFRAYPWLNPVSPFMSWNSAQPTKSLSWYDRYNAVKHDREANFREAKLIHALEAIAACAVMLTAQFGHFGLDWKLKEFFEFTSVPKWTPDEVYVIPYHDTGLRLTAVPFPL